MGKLFEQLKNEVLGVEYDLSVAYLSPAAMQRAMKYKKVLPKETSNVLAFPLSKTSGEILLCKEASAPYTVEYLFIHGLLHLKGLTHSATMDVAEERLLKAFRLKRNK